MYATLDPWGQLSGSVSISVGEFTEFNSMGIKSSKRHPDALQGSCIHALFEKKAHTAEAQPDLTPRKRGRYQK
jgi:hypothetical protein